MGDTFTAAFYHIVWATKGRAEFIHPGIEPLVYSYINAKCSKMGVKVYALNGLADHVHLACSIPPSVTISNLIMHIKGGSSHFINNSPTNQCEFLAWQPGYGLFTYSHNDLSSVVGYVNDQKLRHQSGRLWSILERTDDN